MGDCWQSVGLVCLFIAPHLWTPTALSSECVMWNKHAASFKWWPYVSCVCVHVCRMNIPFKDCHFHSENGIFFSYLHHLFCVLKLRFECIIVKLKFVTFPHFFSIWFASRSHVLSASVSVVTGTSICFWIINNFCISCLS